MHWIYRIKLIGLNRRIGETQSQATHDNAVVFDDWIEVHTGHEKCLPAWQCFSKSMWWFSRKLAMVHRCDSTSKRQRTQPA